MFNFLKRRSDKPATETKSDNITPVQQHDYCCGVCCEPIERFQIAGEEPVCLPKSICVSGYPKRSSEPPYNYERYTTYETKIVFDCRPDKFNEFENQLISATHKSISGNEIIDITCRDILGNYRRRNYMLHGGLHNCIYKKYMCEPGYSIIRVTLHVSHEEFT